MKELYLDDRDVKEVWQEFKGLWWQRAEEDVPKMLKVTLERLSEEELAWELGAGWYEHSGTRRGYRSGRRFRRVVTRWGTLELEIPKVRKGGFVPSVLRRYEQYREDVERLVREMFLSGLSTRQIGPIVWRLTGSSMSASTKRRVVLCAIGIRPDGTKEVVSYMQVKRESASSWEAFLRDMSQRGLSGKQLRFRVMMQRG